jgi:hypothetical protein
VSEYDGDESVFRDVFAGLSGAPTASSLVDDDSNRPFPRALCSFHPWMIGEKHRRSVPDYCDQDVTRETIVLGIRVHGPIVRMNRNLDSVDDDELPTGRYLQSDANRV